MLWYSDGMERRSSNKTYSTWLGMRQRCRNPNSPQFKHYGGRGIRVCARWDKYECFVADMGEKPDGLSLERVDVDGHYSPENCRWATQTEQMRNMRITRRVTIEGQTYVAADLADILGVKTDTIVARAKVCKTYAELMDPERRVFSDGLSLGGKASGAKKQALTHCKNGHVFDDANTHITPQGWRVCRRCRVIRNKRCGERYVFE